MVFMTIREILKTVATRGSGEGRHQRFAARIPEFLHQVPTLFARLRRGDRFPVLECSQCDREPAPRSTNQVEQRVERGHQVDPCMRLEAERSPQRLEVRSVCGGPMGLESGTGAIAASVEQDDFVDGHGGNQCTKKRQLESMVRFFAPGSAPCYFAGANRRMSWNCSRV